MREQIAVDHGQLPDIRCEADKAEVAQRFDSKRRSDPRMIAPRDDDDVDRSERHHGNVGRGDRIAVADEIERAVENVLRELRTRRDAFDRDAGGRVLRSG